MRLLASALLAAMAALYLLTSALQTHAPWLAYVRAFAEAAVVGAVADWFAVVALFRHPFGLPIPHTAIIPRQKDRIADAIGRFVAANLLDLKEVTPRLETMDAAAWLGRWLMEPRHWETVDAGLRRVSPTFLRLLEDTELQAFGEGFVAETLRAFKVTPLLARCLSVALDGECYDGAFNLAADRFRGFLVAHQDTIRKLVGKSSVSWIPGWVDSRVADAILAELIAKLADARDQTAHPWRSEGRRAMQRLIVRLAEDQALARQCEAFKAQLVSQPFLEGAGGWAIAVMREGVARAFGPSAAQSTPLISSDVLRALAHRLEDDAMLRTTFNAAVHDIVLKSVVASRWEVGRFVARVIADWDTPVLVERLELQVGRDLQFIRVNGTLVGGTVGLIIYAASRLFS